MNHLESHQIILGSKSPRRSKLLREMGFTFRVESRSVEETYPSLLDVKMVAEYLAVKKSSVFKPSEESKQLIITADTIVIYSDKILGKPKDLEEAKYFLKLLSNSSHKVHTGVSILTAKKHITFTDSSTVYFSHLSNEAIDFYLKVQPPLDKAGAYGIQDWIGHNFIEKIEGSYTNIMGLPTEKLFQNLQRFMTRRT